jgi:cytochrome d ubiquinol oxidase subunit II
MMNSIAPFWDGNETWLILGGGGMLAAFPLAFVVLMPALYIPIIIMLLGLIFRGVAFEFRFKATGKSRRIWDYAFHFGSLVAALMQGVIIGAIVQGIKVEGRSYAGGAFDWLDAYSVMTGVAVVFGYALLGGTWLVVTLSMRSVLWLYFWRSSASACRS